MSISNPAQGGEAMTNARNALLRVDLPNTVVTAIVVDVLEDNTTSEYADTQIPYNTIQETDAYKLSKYQRYSSSNYA